MDRRRFVRDGSLAASGFAVGGKSLDNVAQRGGSLLYSMDDYVKQVDRGLARIDEWTLTGVHPEVASQIPDADELGRKILKSLYTTAMFRDLELKDQLHPGMQDRMWAMNRTMDEALDGVTALIDAQTPESLREIGAKLREHPEAIDRVARFFELEGGRTGVQDRRQSRTRDTLELIAWRLSNQPPASFVEEYRDKMQKVSDTDVESAAYQRWLVSRAGEKAFWELARQSRRQERIGRGLRNMGIGVLIALAGALLVSVDDSDGAPTAVGAVALTVGSIWFLVGFLILLVGVGTPGEAP